MLTNALWPRLKTSLRHAERACGKVWDVLWPPLCLLCESPIVGDHVLCRVCWEKVSFLAPPLCSQCGAPIGLHIDEDTLCASCQDDPHAYAKARSAFAYNENSRALILRFKHGDQLHGVPTFAQWMAKAGRELIESSDIVAPVPLHRWRLLKRRYNQAALLALAIGKIADKPVRVDLLTRRKQTPSQGHLSRKAREANVRGAFALGKRAEVKGKTVLLIDDVMTSGATSDACARVLLKAGAARVNVLTLARAGSEET